LSVWSKRMLRPRGACIALALVALSTPGFASDRSPELGTVGTYDYSVWLLGESLKTPPHDAEGLWSVLAITNIVCGYVSSGNRTLASLVPEGFRVVRGDVHEFGWQMSETESRWVRLSITGDKLEDAAGGHPYWTVRFAGNGDIAGCGVTFGGDETVSTADAAARERAIRLLYSNTPQMFRAIIVEPNLAGFYPLTEGGLIRMAKTCGAGWCELAILYDLRPGRWMVDLRIDLDTPADPGTGVPHLFE